MFRRHVVLTFVTAALSLSWVAVAVAADWPTYQHDTARSGVTDEQLKLPFKSQWVHVPAAAPRPAWADPQPVPVEGVLEPPKVKFDDAFYVSAAGGLVFYGSSTENLVCAMDAATGQVRWRYYTEGPVRLAPTVSGGRVYFGSDDGCITCLRAEDGVLVWQRPVGPTRERVIGHGKMISLWPVRSSVLVDDGVAYFTGGIFPGERVYVCAVRADDGTLLWNNDTMSDTSAGQNGFSPQGYLLATKTQLYVPSGRALPAAFARDTGKFLYQRADGRWNYGVVGGTYALLAGEHLYGGTGQVIGYEQATGTQGFAWFPGKRLVITADTSYMLTDAGVTALDRVAYPEASRKLIGARFKRATLQGANPKPKDYDAKLAAIDEESKQAQAAVDASTRFRYERTGLETMIVSGNTLLTGGKDLVTAVDRASGQEFWSAAVKGLVKGLAVADGRLLVSMDNGAIQCFAATEPPPPMAEAKREAFPRDELTPVFEQAADTILKLSRVRRGYCLVLGSRTGRLAYELARRSELTIYGTDTDAERVAATREALRRAGLYGPRVSVDHVAAGPLPYSDYFANLIVSEDAVLGRMPSATADVARLLKPCGGVLCLGQPATVPALAAKLSADKLSDSCSAWNLNQPQISRNAGVWATCTRGALPGAGSWTHQYGDAGNTASSTDTIVKAPLGVLWYGEPGPDKVPSRHLGNAAPLSLNGRVYLQGINRLMCFDAYNGLPYWERELPGAYRVGMVYEAGNLACDDRSLYVSVGKQCLQLDAMTGKTTRTYNLPRTAGEKATWGYVALVGARLYGSTLSKGQFSDSVFSVDTASGAIRWVAKGGAIRNNTIALSDGRLFFADATVTPAQRQEALAEKIKQLVATKGLSVAEAEKALTSADVRLVSALDANTGKKLWQRPVDLTDCGPHVLIAIATRGVLLFCGAHADGHYWPQFLGGEYGARRAVALAMQDGAPMWSKAIGYRIRPLVVEDTLIAEPWAFNLQTGAQQMRAHPVTGEQTPWQFERPGHHCGCISGSPNGLYYRSWSLAYYDFLRDQGTEHFGGQRPGCWINAIPANGLLVMPEASSGCICLVSIHCTTVFKPRETEKAWGLFSAPGAGLPVKQLALNFGAPGDRRAPDGTIWLGFPRPWQRMPVTVKADVTLVKDGAYYASAAETSRFAGSDLSWVYASGVRGLKACTIPLVGPADGPATYKVKLGFVETDASATRSFDIKLQGNVVETAFNPLRAAGGVNKVVIREYSGLRVDDNLKLEFAVPAGDIKPQQMPILNSLEVVRERVLHVGIKAPDLIVSDASPQAAGKLQLANRTEQPFTGVLRVSVPPNFAATPAEQPVKLAVNEQMELPVQVQSLQKGAAQVVELRLQLMRADGTVEIERTARVEYLGPRGRIVIPAAEDTYVSAGGLTTNYGHNASLLVDGGSSRMGDESHNLTYLRFPLQVPGKITRVTLRIHTSPSEAAESNDSGRICLLEQPWDENKITYDNRPPPGVEIGRLTKVGRNLWEERELKVDLAGKTQLSLMLDPTSTDGASYLSREGGTAPELVIEYEAAP